MSNPAFTLGAERWRGGRHRSRPAHVFQNEAEYSLCGRVHSASVWNWFPGSAIEEADCARCLERWRARAA